MSRPMIRIAAVAGALAGMLAGGPPPAGAETRPDARAMTCAQAAALVASRRAVVLGAGPFLYERYVADGGACSIDETTEPAWIATADAPMCFVGYRCRERSRDFGRR